jgi:hypothetical protein
LHIFLFAPSHSVGACVCWQQLPAPVSVPFFNVWIAGAGPLRLITGLFSLALQGADSIGFSGQ